MVRNTNVISLLDQLLIKLCIKTPKKSDLVLNIDSRTFIRPSRYLYSRKMNYRNI